MTIRDRLLCFIPFNENNAFAPMAMIKRASTNKFKLMACGGLNKNEILNVLVNFYVAK
jgi:hypothetical protein